MDDAIDEHKIVTGAVKVAEVASDSVGPDEMIETDAFNLTSTSSTYVGNAMTASSVSAAALAGTIMKTTEFASAGTQSGYFLGFADFPAAATSTIIGNTVVGATSRIFLTADGNPRVSYGATASAGSITATASSAPGSIVPLSYIVVTPG